MKASMESLGKSSLDGMAGLGGSSMDKEEEADRRNGLGESLIVKDSSESNEAPTIIGK
jgi:hypothetical protein